MLRTALLIGLGGFVGANLRYWLGGWIAQKIGVLFPIETMLINISGSFLLGLFMTLALHYTWSPEWRQVVAIGFIGSFTTYSTYEYESLRLLQEGAWVKAGLNLFGSLVLGLIAVFLGVAHGRLGRLVVSRAGGVRLEADACASRGGVRAGAGRRNCAGVAGARRAARIAGRAGSECAAVRQSDWRGAGANAPRGHSRPPARPRETTPLRVRIVVAPLPTSPVDGGGPRPPPRSRGGLGWGHA